MFEYALKIFQEEKTKRLEEEEKVKEAEELKQNGGKPKS
jgi:hypothetical protein